MSKLVLVRHGLSAENANGAICGQIDSPLIDEGLRQARAVARLLGGISFRSFHASDLQRAKHTLAAIVIEMGILELSLRFSPALRERSWGAWEGRPKTVLDTPEGQRIWRSWDVRPDGGESRADVSSRVVAYHQEFIVPELRAGKDILVVGHNGSLRTHQMHIEGIPHEESDGLSLPNCGAKVYEFDGDCMLVSSCLSIP